MFVGCTAHPPGESDERKAALAAGKPFEGRFDQRNIPPLSVDPSLEDLVRYALLSNAELEQKYWEWRSAIEQIPQDGTQATNLALSINQGFSRGSTGIDRTTLSGGNDPMTDIVLPAKLSTAARRALENARASGFRFRKAQLDLRSKVISAYCDYALTAELIRLEQSNGQLLKTTANVVEARNRAGGAGQQDLLKALTEVDLSANEVSAMQAQLPGQSAVVNALLGRPSWAELPIPAQLPPSKPFAYTDEKVRALAEAQDSPEQSAMAREIAGRKEGRALAKLQYLPDFSVGVGTDLAGIGQSLLGVATVPYLRHEAIDAAVAQAEANLRASEAMRRQAGNDQNARMIMDIRALRDADRQLGFFDKTILPRTRRIVAISRSAYETGRATLLELIDSQRSLIAIERLVANLRVSREKRLADLEAILQEPIEGLNSKAQNRGESNHAASNHQRLSDRP